MKQVTTNLSGLSTVVMKSIIGVFFAYGQKVYYVTNEKKQLCLACDTNQPEDVLQRVNDLLSGEIICLAGLDIDGDSVIDPFDIDFSPYPEDPEEDAIDRENLRRLGFL